MGLLEPIEENERAVLDEIVNSKIGNRRARLRALRPRILRRYSTYRSHTADLASLPASNFAGVDRADCEHCYDQETTPLSLLKKAVAGVLPSSNNFYCPLCGLGKWETFDHFIPKSLFPEFSVLPRNLIPCCWRCNHLKGNRWDAGLPSAVLNVYYDSWPRQRFLVANIDFDLLDGASVSFSLIRRIRSGRVSRARLERHFEELDLGPRFAEAGASAVDRYHRSLALHAFSTRAQRKRYLRREAAALAAKYGVNHWESVVLEGLTNCNEFLDSF
jgi:hypothetical protein